MFNQIKIDSVSEATLGVLLRDGPRTMVLSELYAVRSRT